MSDLVSPRQEVPDPRDLPLGEFGASDYATVQRLCGILETHRHLMRDDDYDSIIALLRTGYHQHSSGSVVDPEHHHIYTIMFDGLAGSFNMRHVTYVNWIFLAAIYGPSHGRLQKFREPLESMYGWDLTRDLSFHHDIYTEAIQRRGMRMRPLGLQLHRPDCP
ncbi:hypothetical protein CEP54_000302 [Fusarium duplospermum]|uniref:Uncharacterized protein n=1 Tax=Fusarium duplospermum TaxID=1325734 RepID=A0A428R6S0_9HYPO|nr:hypothetical protein CEP54_000302 [Fusarium duplospermum]